MSVEIPLSPIDSPDAGLILAECILISLNENHQLCPDQLDQSVQRVQMFRSTVASFSMRNCAIAVWDEGQITRFSFRLPAWLIRCTENLNLSILVSGQTATLSSPPSI
jgi:hypothetical protein